MQSDKLQFVLQLDQLLNTAQQCHITNYKNISKTELKKINMNRTIIIAFLVCSKKQIDLTPLTAL